MSATNWAIVPTQMVKEYGAFGGMRIGRGNQTTWRKPALDGTIIRYI
jgi:hypothetical protein